MSSSSALGPCDERPQLRPWARGAWRPRGPPEASRGLELAGPWRRRRRSLPAAGRAGPCAERSALPRRLSSREAKPSPLKGGRGPHARAGPAQNADRDSPGHILFPLPIQSHTRTRHSPYHIPKVILFYPFTFNLI